MSELKREKFEESDLIDRDDIETCFKVDPPVEKIKGAYGFLGVLLRNKEHDKLQCHVCGTWKKGLDLHIIYKHKMTPDEYRIKYSLPLNFPLCSKKKSMSTAMRSIGQKNIEHLKKVRNIKKLQTKDERWKQRHKYAYVNRAYENINNFCPQQIERRFLIVADTVGHSPGVNDLVKHDQSLWAAIRRRYSTLNEYKKEKGFGDIKICNKKTDHELIGILRGFFEKNKRIPTKRDFLTAKEGLPCSETFVNTFGSWQRALLVSGVGTPIKKANI